MHEREVQRRGTDAENQVHLQRAAEIETLKPLHSCLIILSFVARRCKHVSETLRRR